MKTLKNKMKNKKGFTLMEMLIVVAIMVVLMAVAIPMFTSQLNGAKANVDKANERAAKSAIITEYMANQSKYTADFTLYFDVTDGSLKTNATDIVPYGQSSGRTKQVVGYTFDVSELKVGDPIWADGKTTTE